MCDTSIANRLLENKDTYINKVYIDIFKETANLYPNRTAVYQEGLTISYRELDILSSRCSKKLLSCGALKGDVVAIESGRSIKTIAAMLGAWKIGAAYVYIDAAYPKLRVDRILSDTRCKYIIDDSWWDDIESYATDIPKADVSGDDLALIIYTSGSTARPKGVMLSQKNVVATMYNFDVFDIKEGDHFGVFPSFGFVASVSDIFSSLAVGAVIYLIHSAIRRDIKALRDYYYENNIKATFLPPHMVRKLLAENLDGIPIKTLLVGSEAVSNIPAAPFRMLNIYGSSEMTSMAAHYEIKEINSPHISPIGVLSEGIEGYIMDDKGRPVKRGEEGELWLSGRQVCLGYYNMPEETAKHFIKNPFDTRDEYKVVFKTNDIVRLDENNNLVYICRKDNVYKIRGFRVENTAVEDALHRICDKLDEVAVTAFVDKGGCNILCAYVTSKEKVDPKKAKNALRSIIPYYMIPSCILQLDSMPHNFNGKVDRKALVPPAELNDHKKLEELY